MQYRQFQPSLGQHANGTETTYLRRDIAGFILPWLYTLAWLLIHIAARADRHRAFSGRRWQMLSLFLAAVSIASFTQEHPAQAGGDPRLVWSPLAVIVDVWAFKQLFFPVVESSKGGNVNEFVPLSSS